MSSVSSERACGASRSRHPRTSGHGCVQVTMTDRRIGAFWQPPSTPVLGTTHRHPGESARQLTFGELGDVDERESGCESVDERAVEEMDDEAAVLVHVLTVGDAGTVVRVVGGARGVDDETTGAHHPAQLGDEPLE